MSRIIFRLTIGRRVVASQAGGEIPKLGAESVEVILPRSQGRGWQQWQPSDLSLEIIDKRSVSIILESFGERWTESWEVLVLQMWKARDDAYSGPPSASFRAQALLPAVRVP